MFDWLINWNKRHYCGSTAVKTSKPGPYSNRGPFLSHPKKTCLLICPVRVLYSKVIVLERINETPLNKFKQAIGKNWFRIKRQI